MALRIGPSRRVELGYTEITTDYGGAGLAATEADVTGLTVTVTCDGVSPVEIEAYCPLVQKLVNAGAIFLYLYEGATKLVTTPVLPVSGGINEYGLGLLKRRLIPTAGAHTYKVRMAMTSVGGLVDVGTDGPAYIAVVQR